MAFTADLRLPCVPAIPRARDRLATPLRKGTDLRARRTLPSAGGAQAQTRHRLYMDGPLELDARHAAGIDVELLWDPRTQGLSVVAHDAMSDETVTIFVEADQALEVFRHPFAYAGEPAPRMGLRVKA
jgi:hypothetical protein